MAVSGSPILITGAHRTGTTWVGRMLTGSGETAYISEPLNVLHRPGIFNAPVTRWYEYICPENESVYLPAFRSLLRFNYHLWAELRSLRSRRDLLRMGRDYLSFVRGRLAGARPLVKDPFAVLSAEWFARRLGFKVVVTVRHPAAFFSSLKRLNWSFDLRDLFTQPLLMRDWLEPFRRELETAARAPDDLLTTSALLWKVIYAAVWKMEQRNPDFHLVRHEDLSLEPVGSFRDLYAALGLTFSRRAQKFILTSSNAENPAELSLRAVHSVKLDSRWNVYNWQRRLKPEEISRIRALTEEVAAHFYSEQDWQA